MSKAAVIDALYTNAQLQEALREDAHIYGLKYTEDMSEFGAYYSPEVPHGTPGDPDYVPGVIPEFALIDPDISMRGLRPNDNSRTMHFGSPVTINAKGLEIPWTLWGNGAVIGKSADDGEEKTWLDHGDAGNDRILFFGEKFVKNPNTGETTENVAEAFKIRGDGEAAKLKDMMRKQHPDAQIFVGMLDNEGRLVTPFGAAKIIDDMNQWKQRTKGMADDGESSLTNNEEEANVANYNVSAMDALIHGITMNYYMGKKHGLTDDQKRDILKGKGTTLKGKMKVKRKRRAQIDERTFEETPEEAPVEEIERVERTGI